MRALGSATKRRWFAFAERLGTFQMRIILGVIYVVFVTPLALPFKLLADPLALKSREDAGWHRRREPDDLLASMRKQYSR
jgi:hypothetical protein